MSKHIEALKLALEALDCIYSPLHVREINKVGSAMTAIKEALAQEQEPEPDRVKFERHWRKTRGEKKANRELPRHPLQPQTYIQDSANRHWVTWQAAVRSVAPPAQRKPLTDEIPKGVLLAISNAGLTLLKTQHGYELRKLGPAIAHGIKGEA